jgi:hypothetical protein
VPQIPATCPSIACPGPPTGLAVPPCAAGSLIHTHDQTPGGCLPLPVFGVSATALAPGAVPSKWAHPEKTNPPGLDWTAL